MQELIVGLVVILLIVVMFQLYVSNIFGGIASVPGKIFRKLKKAAPVVGSAARGVNHGLIKPLGHTVSKAAGGLGKSVGGLGKSVGKKLNGGVGKSFGKKLNGGVGHAIGGLGGGLGKRHKKK